MKTYDFPNWTVVLPEKSLAQLRRELKRARQFAIDLDSLAARNYLTEVESTLQAAQHRVSVGATPMADGITERDVDHVWSGIEHTENVLTSLNSVGKNGRRKPHRLQRTRNSILKIGDAGFLMKPYSAAQSNGHHNSTAYRNLWAALSAARADLTLETWTIENAHRLDAARVGTAHDIILALWPMFGLDVPERPAHAAPVNKRSVARMRRAMAEEMLSLGSHYGVKLPDTPAFNTERLSIEAEHRAALERAGFCCEHPGCRVAVYEMLHVHHVVHRARGGSDARDNLRVPCANHHSLEHRRKRNR